MTEIDITGPFDQYRNTVQKGWIDHNQHMNMGFYLVVLDMATEAWFDYIGLDRAHRERHNISTFSLEAHITYQREVGVGDPLRFTTQLIAFDEKRIHYYHEMYHAERGYLSATNELMSLHVSRETRRATPMHETILNRLAEIQQAHDQLPTPTSIGRIIGLNAKPTTPSEIKS